MPETRATGDKALSTPKYPRPKVMLIDVAAEAKEALEAEGYNISVGSFGKPYKVPLSDEYVPVIQNGRLPNFTEQEIVVIDLVPTGVLDGPVGEKATSAGETDLWARASRGVIDPRPRLREALSRLADRIFSNGGIFFIFASARYSQTQYLAHMRGYSLQTERTFPYGNWSFLPVLNSLVIKHDVGQEISVVANPKSPLGRLLTNHADEAEFVCTVRPEASIEDSWITLAENKYGEPVAGVIAPRRSGRGAVFVLPQIEDKAGFLTDMIKNVLPEIRPDLFPHAEGARWVQRPEYEIPEIQALKDEVRSIEEEARRKVSELEEDIEAKRAETSYMHNLIGGTDRPLVLAVKRTLEVMGFEHVVDVDEAMEAAGDTGRRREDLQIWDTSPILLIEVKGMAGIPSDEDSMAVAKYLAPRMKEWNRTDIKGLSLMNHQRHIPALERKNEKAFREDVVTNAEEQDIGLLTAWDLYRLLRSYLRNGWRPEYVKPLLYKNGRISPVPEHYELVGIIEGFIPKKGVVGIRITGDRLRRGDHIAFELPVEFWEQEASSLEINNQPVDEAVSGEMVGTLTALTKDLARQGTRVFRLTQ